MDEKILRVFRNYYRDTKLLLPPRFTTREYGFMFFDKNYMIRHRKFSREQQLHNYLIQNVPAHVYYSTAYYKIPDATNMSEKVWLGADLVFDLDADHLPAAQNLTYVAMLELVKKELKKLVFEFLLSDFGFKETELELYFSGGRGYHVHVRNNRILSMKSNERRELVAYIRGSGLTKEHIFRISKTISNKKVKENIGLYKPTDAGWSGKFSANAKKFLQTLLLKSTTNNTKYLKALCRKYSKTSKCYKELFGNDAFKLKELINADRPSFNILTPSTAQALTAMLENEVFENMRGEIDEPVTADIHRLIRLPKSLHGKTGLAVTPVLLRDIDDFDPLIDAIPPIFKKHSLKLAVVKDIQIKMNDELFTLKEGEIFDAPAYLAIFLKLRKFGKIL